MHVVINKHRYNDYSSKFINDCTEFKYYFAKIGDNRYKLCHTIEHLKTESM